MNQNVPAPQPPWSRPMQSPMVQTIVSDDAIDLTTDASYINCVTPKAGGGPYLLTIPDGNVRRQTKRIFVVGSTIAATAPFKLTGTFAGFSYITFNNAATSAILEWDSTAWAFIGGNAQLS